MINYENHKLLSRLILHRCKRRFYFRIDDQAKIPFTFFFSLIQFLSEFKDYELKKKRDEKNDTYKEKLEKEREREKKKTYE